MMQPPHSYLIALALIFMIPGNAAASPPDHWGQRPPSVSVEFLVAGRPLSQQRDRHGATYVAVLRWGIEYEIRIKNHDPADRVLFVIGVDGLSVMDGSPASQHSGGYVLDPGQSARIRGWRRGDFRVAAFTFTGRDDSYAGRTRHHGHIGEVWVWAIREKSARPRPPVKITPSTKQRREKSGNRAHLSDRETGTGYGDELVDHVRATEFVRSSSMRHLDFRYGLRRTVKPDPRRGGGSPGNFAPPPRGWKGKRK